MLSLSALRTTSWFSTFVSKSFGIVLHTLDEGRGALPPNKNLSVGGSRDTFEFYIKVGALSVFLVNK